MDVVQRRAWRGRRLNASMRVRSGENLCGAPASKLGL
jgi:hypothetical protein